MAHVQSLSQEVGSGDEGLGLFSFYLSSVETDFCWLGEEQSSRNRNQYTASTWGHGFRRSWRIWVLLQMSLIMLADNRETSPPIFVFLKKNLNAPRPFSCFVWHISVHHGSGQARVFSMYPRRWLCLLGSRAKIYTRFVSDSAVHTYFGRAPLSLLTRQQKWYYRLQQAQSLILIGCTAVCTCWVLYFCIQHTRYCLKKNAVHQPVLVQYYCCFHLNYGTTTYRRSRYFHPEQEALAPVRPSSTVKRV